MYCKRCNNYAIIEGNKSFIIERGKLNYKYCTNKSHLICEKSQTKPLGKYNIVEAELNYHMQEGSYGRNHRTSF
jgi:hypothetical protein